MIRDKGAMTSTIGSPATGPVRPAPTRPTFFVRPPPLRRLRDLLPRRPDHPARAPVMPVGINIRRCQSGDGPGRPRRRRSRAA